MSDTSTAARAKRLLAKCRFVIGSIVFVLLTPIWLPIVIVLLAFDAATMVMDKISEWSNE